MARATLALLWVYQGLVPKLLVADSGERELAAALAFVGSDAATWVRAAGIAELLFGVALLAAWRSRLLPALALLVLPLLALGGALADPAIVGTAFNAPTLTLAAMALATIDLVAGNDVTSAARCGWSSRRQRG